MTLHITEHARARVRERLNIPKKAVDRVVINAFENGKKHSDFSGKFRRYLDGVFLKHCNATNMRVHGHHLFIFDNETLITAWIVPPMFRALAERAGGAA